MPYWSWVMHSLPSRNLSKPSPPWTNWFRFNRSCAGGLRDGAIFGEVGVPVSDPAFTKMFPGAAKALSEVEVKGHGLTR
jgi:hypothetical protein